MQRLATSLATGGSVMPAGKPSLIRKRKNLARNQMREPNKSRFKQQRAFDRKKKCIEAARQSYVEDLRLRVYCRRCRGRSNSERSDESFQCKRERAHACCARAAATGLNIAARTRSSPHSGFYRIPRIYKKTAADTTCKVLQILTEQ